MRSNGTSRRSIVVSISLFKLDASVGMTGAVLGKFHTEAAVLRGCGLDRILAISSKIGGDLGVG